MCDYYRKNPQALAALRAPIFEEKVVDFLVELANVTEKKVSREELFKEDEQTGRLKLRVKLVARLLLAVRPVLCEIDRADATAAAKLAP